MIGANRLVAVQRQTDMVTAERARNALAVLQHPKIGDVSGFAGFGNQNAVVPFGCPVGCLFGVTVGVGEGTMHTVGAAVVVGTTTMGSATKLSNLTWSARWT